MNLKRTLRSWLPYSLRVEAARLRHMPSRHAEWRHCAKLSRSMSDANISLAQDSSPLHRDLSESSKRLRAAKETNIRVAAAQIDTALIQPGQIFSYHALVGRPSRRIGFRRGLELHNETMAKGVGGGACKVTNLLYRVALSCGMLIVERHRHSLDLFPDKGRRVPFGLGATVFYNYADFQFLNPLNHPIQIRIGIHDGALVADFKSPQPLPWAIELYEKDHRFTRDKSGFIRENKIRRRYIDHKGQAVKDELIAHNRARVLYQPNLALVS